MSALKSLTLTALPKAEHSPVQLRRSRLIERLEGSKVTTEGPCPHPGRPEMEEAGRRASPDRKEAAGSPVVADGRKGPGRVLRSDRMEAAGVREGQGRVVAGTMEKPPRVIDTLIGGIRAGELDPMLEQAKTARPAPKKKAA